MSDKKKPTNSGPPRRPRAIPMWFDELEWTTSGRGQQLKSNLTNAVLVLTHEEAWAGVLGWNLFSGRVEKLLPPPCPEALMPEGGTKVGVFDEDDAVRTAGWFESHPEYHVRFNEELIYKAARIVAQRRSFHPLCASLERWSSAWDHVHRIDTWLIDLLGAEDTPYTRLVGRFFLLGAVARAFNPGCKVDHVLILEGEQGVRKSSVAETLFGAYFTDTPIDLGSKDAYLSIRNKWGVELGELDSLSKAEATRIKAFFSSRCDRYREPYARVPIEVQRSCVFIGTTNLDQYLKDATGGRRFLPVRLPAEVDLVVLAALREQLWGEAVKVYKTGARWWPEGEEKEWFAEEAEDRFVNDAWRTPIATWLDKQQLLAVGGQPLSITTHQVLKEAIGKETQHITHADATRVGSILHHLKWRSHRPRKNNPTRERFYYPPEKPVVQPVQPGPTTVQATNDKNNEHRSALVQPVQPAGEFPTRTHALAAAREYGLDHLDQKEEKNSLRARSVMQTSGGVVDNNDNTLLLQRFLAEVCLVGGSESLRVFQEAFALWAVSQGKPIPPTNTLLPALTALDVPVMGDRVRGLRIADERISTSGGPRGSA